MFLCLILGFMTLWLWRCILGQIIAENHEIAKGSIFGSA